MDNKEKYEILDMNVIRFEAVDVITVSLPATPDEDI